MGALRRTLVADVVAASKSSSRAFSVSARRFEEGKDAAPSAPPAANRKARAANALNQITRLGANRRAPGGPARGPSSEQANGPPARGPPRVRPEGGLKITRGDGFSGGAPPSGSMARAPAQLNLSRGPRGPRSPGNASVGGRRGPNLGGRDRAAGNRGSKEKANKRAAKDAGDEREPTGDLGSVDIQEVFDHGMTHQLYRLQRSEWDRKPYEPKYAPGSFAANQLIHAGRELFRGESPPVKKWGMLEKRIGVVGMHGAEGRLEIRRVVDEGNERLGERREYSESGDIDLPVKVKARQSETAKPAAAASPVKAQMAKAAATKVPAPKPAAVVQ